MARAELEQLAAANADVQAVWQGLELQKDKYAPASSPIPAGSCVVTAEFSGAPLTITGNETEDIVVIVKVSNNKSFEWTDTNGDGYYQPDRGDVPTDMGVRGIQPIVQ